MHDTLSQLDAIMFPAVYRSAVSTLQLNLGYMCNLACLHCHVNAGPTRKELMSRDIIDLALIFGRKKKIKTIDLTGGSPEMNPHFQDLVIAARSEKWNVLDRLNPTLIEEPGYEWLASFLAKQHVEVIASLPCYSAVNVDQQRGDGVFAASVAALKKLNDLGYGHADSGLILNLVYNPIGPTLPPPQNKLEADYKKMLYEHFGIKFNRLFTITNMPIKRFGSTLLSRGQFDDYLNLLQQAYRHENLDQVMCKSLVSVDYQGYVYDCDFNQMLGLPLGGQSNSRVHLRDLLETDLQGRAVRVAGHCYGCTAGQGSSCGGALS
jgi:radical SAM/Cys-rich protein